MCVCFGRVSLHCFNSCTPGIIYGPISSRCMRVASRWNYNGECMIKIFQGGRGDTPSNPPPPTNNFRLYPPPVLRCFWKDLLMTPTPITPLQASFTATPSPSTTPSPGHKNVDHTLRCSAFCGVYNIRSVVSVMFLYPSRNDGGPHRNCTLYTRVICVLSAFLRKFMRNQHQNENVAERFYIDLKGPVRVFVPELHMIVPFSGT